MDATKILLSDQLELTVGQIELNGDRKDDTKKTIADALVICVCGDAMFKQKISEYNDEYIFCKICGFRYSQSDHGAKYIYICDKKEEDALYHPYNFCVSCLEITNNFDRNPIKDVYKAELLYFIYNNNTISGPYNIDEIINSYIRKQINSGQIWIKNASKSNTKWYQLTIPNKWNDYRELTFSDEKRLQLINNYIIKNKEIKERFPKLYTNLVENVISNRINQIVLPTNMPPNAKKSSKITLITVTFGKIIAILLAIIIIFHCIISIFVVSILCIVLLGLITLCGNFRNNILKNHSVIYLVFLLCLSGMFISPILLIYIVLLRNKIWNMIQSWMIGYICWGIISWLLPAAFILALVTHNWKMVNIYTQLILLVIGIDFGSWDIDDVGETQGILGLFVIIMIFPSLVSVLPSAIIGFIANFMLEEKFLLTCNEHKNDNVSSCSLYDENKHGCCQIVSSHDLENSYSFVGGLASNIIAIWAMIRIIGYLIVNSYPSLALFARRKK